MKKPIAKYFADTFWAKTEEAVSIQLIIIGFSCYLWGRFGGSFLLVIIMVMAGYVILKQTSIKERRERVQRLVHDKNLWENRKFLRRLLTEIPVWIRSGEWEQGRFLQTAMEQGWPAIRKLTDVMLRTYVDPLLDWSKPGFLKSIKFGDINLGSRWPHIEGIQNAGDPNQEQMILDIKLAIQPANLDLHIQPMSGVGIKAGLRDLTLNGTFRLVFAPLVGDSPFIGGIRLGFAERPAINFKVQTGGMGVKLIPKLESYLEKLVESLIVDWFCWPNDIFLPLIDIEKPTDDADDPKGLLTVLPIRARELQNTTKLSKISKPDPFCEVSIHGKKQRTKTAKNTMAPTWTGNPMEFILKDMKNSILELTVFDKNRTSNKKMGYAKVHLGSKEWDLEKDDLPVKKWLKLMGTRSGEVQLQLLWQPYQTKVTDPVEPDMSLALDYDNGVAGMAPTSVKHGTGLLIIEIKSAQNLIAKDLFSSSSDPYVKIYLHSGKNDMRKVAKTAVKKQTLQPSWDEEFRVKVEDSLTEIIRVVVFDHNKLSKHDELGNVNIPIKDIVANNCSVDDWYNLGKEKGKINIKVRYMFH